MKTGDEENPKVDKSLAVWSLISLLLETINIPEYKWGGYEHSPSTIFYKVMFSENTSEADVLF